MLSLPLDLSGKRSIGVLHLTQITPTYCSPGFASLSILLSPVMAFEELSGAIILVLLLFDK